MQIGNHQYEYKKKAGRPLKEMEGAKSRLQKDIMEQLQYNGDLSDEQLQLLKDTLTSTIQKYSVEKEEVSENKVAMNNNQLIEEFLETKRVENKSYNTIYNYGNEIQKMFLVINKPCDEITTTDIRKYLDYRKQHDQLRAVSINNIRMYLMSFFKWCYVEEHIEKNPMDRIGVVKAEKKVIEVLTDEECEMIRCACDNERDLAIVDLLSSSGMRVSELTGLNRQDVDFEKGEVIVFGKGSKERVCFITGKAKVHLKWYLSQRTDNNPALFVTAKKPYTRLTKNGVEYILKNIASRTNIPKLRLYPHKYRSTLATNMFNKGASIDQVQHILGHSSPSVTDQVYVNANTSTIKNAHHTYVS